MPKNGAGRPDHRGGDGLAHEFAIEYPSGVSGKGEPHIVSRGWWIQDPNGKPGEKVFVDKLPQDQEDALSNHIFNSFKPVLLDRIDKYLNVAGLEVNDFTPEAWERLVRVTIKLLFATGDTQRGTEGVEELRAVLLEVAHNKLEAASKKPATPRRKQPKKR